MKIRTLCLTLFLVISLSFPAALANEDAGPRGKYVYDEAGVLSIKDTLGLSALLWKQDIKTGYETVFVFPKEKLSVEQMGKWFDTHGVGDPKAETGLTIFIFSDNTVYGMVGRKHDRIAAPYLTYFAANALKGFEKDRVRALNNLSIELRKQLDTPTTYERAYNVGKTVVNNLHIIMGWASLIALIVLLYKQKDGFQADDLLWPAIILILTLIVAGIMSVGSNDNLPSYTKEYGIINSTKEKSNTYSEQHCVGSDDDEVCWWDTHTEYFNYVGILSYDFKPYNYRFYSKDSKWAWQRTEGELLGMEIYIQGDSVESVEFPIRDNSGGQTDNYGSWIIMNAAK